ncbi:DNA-directed RNA polymerase subunit M [Striga asiatica]|uniref:DNA-directed RNA polymerase subunit M n=1 Tax=Striga asiatica TaxID=4170 RepID=A0A5A7QF76_STRAF|nr:DNA-directed RNA polymerase subunit M [Striga asiatica]
MQSTGSTSLPIQLERSKIAVKDGPSKPQTEGMDREMEVEPIPNSTALIIHQEMKLLPQTEQTTPPKTWKRIGPKTGRLQRMESSTKIIIPHAIGIKEVCSGLDGIGYGSVGNCCGIVVN